jgi:hypothetical protein
VSCRLHLLYEVLLILWIDVGVVVIIAHIGIIVV